MPRAKKSDDAAALAVVSRAAKRAAAVQTDCAEESDLLDGIEPQSRRQACEQARARLIEAQLKVKVGYGIDRDPSCLFEPVGDRLIVRRDSREMISPGGIVMPENSTAPPNSGVVLSVGPGAWIGGTAERRPMQVRVGDRVIISAFSESLQIGRDTELVLLREDEILAIVRA